MNTASTVAGMAGMCALAVLAGCSQSTAPAPTGAVAAAAARTAGAEPSACERPFLNVEDVGGLLSLPITQAHPLPGDPQSCEFVTATFPAIIVSVRPGLGRSTLDAWTTGKIPLDSRPLLGVGEGAVWIEALHEVVAQKNAVLCDIKVRGGGSDLAVDAGALPALAGALCNKVFAVY